MSNGALPSGALPSGALPSGALPSSTPPAAGHIDQVRALFDTKAAGWPGKYAPDGRLAGRLTRLAGAASGLTAAGGQLLDLGCASGELARQLAAAGYRVIGCDIAPQMLRLAAAADQRQRVSWIRLDSRWQTLPFAPDSLDTVVASSVLEYVLEPLTVLRECARVLRPGGILLCTVPDPAHPVRWLERPLGWAARTAPARAAGEAWPRLGRYLTYLRISRQRGGIRWWRATARHAGLRPVPLEEGPRSRGPLRMLAFSPAARESGHGQDDGTDGLGGLL